jgi:hypothetical protein
MKKLMVASAILLFSISVVAQDSLQARIILIGDAGQLTNGRHYVVSAAKRLIPMNSKTTVIFLGDNLYKTGLPDNSLPTYDIAKAPLDSQITIAGNNPVKVYFVPGNHDWANGGDLGYESVLRVQSYIDFLANKNVQMFPRDGCAGPVEMEITKDIVLVMMDSQWWIHQYDKPGIESDCPYKTKAEVLAGLDDILSRNSQKLVLLAFHHTLRSYSPHGGYFTFKEHIFPLTDIMSSLYIPLPILGSIYPLTRAVFGTSQDIKHPFYQEMISSIESVVKGHPNVIYVAGHDHSLQLIQDSAYNYIVSGSGSKNSRVNKSRQSLYANHLNGFWTLEVSKNKNVKASVYVVEGDSAHMDYSSQILDFSKLQLPKPDTTHYPDYVFKDSVVISASDKYKDNVGFRKAFLGTNYRKEWSTPIVMEEFNIKKQEGGLTIKSMGGGKQTKSLRLEDKKGNEWTLRTVDKDPEKALPQNLRGTLAQGIVQDMISASHPYGALAVPTLARAAGVITPDPKIFYVPADPQFGIYREMFANTVTMLEERDPGAKYTDTKSTDKVINKMLEDNDHHVDQESVLNARLLDMLIGDFDRHFDQWKWGTTDTGVGKLYFPIPKDRDQAFFNPNGILSRLLRKAMPFLQGFKKNIIDINGLNYVARDFDRVFMNNMDEATWERVTKDFQNNMTDAVIEKAVSNFPKEIAAIDAKNIADKLKSRRDGLLKNAIKYYHFLSREISVAGSNKSEYFHIKNAPNGIHLIVYKKIGSTDSASVMYDRVIDQRVTHELRLYGLNGNDKFEIDPDVNSRIKLRIIGGKGNDTFDLKGNIHNFVYDLTTEKNALVNLKRTNKELSSSTSINDYKYSGFEYSKIRFPRVQLGFNEEDRLLLGVGAWKRTYGFRKLPYATDQKFSALYAPSSGAYQLKYDGIFNKVISKEDLLIHAQLSDPSLNNFFGLGNESVFDKSKGLHYYRTRYKYFEADALIRKRMSDLMEFSIGPAYYHYWARYKDNADRILADPAIISSDSASIFGVKQFIGFKAKFDINYVNNETFPTRGITWYTDFVSLSGMNSNSHSLVKLTSDMNVYASIRDPGRIGAAFRFGGGHIFSKGYEYFQALNIGANNYVRGYRKNRFSGSSMAYGSAELRLKLFKSQSYIFPGDVGVLGFYDIGRVWERGETSHKWHGAYGGGLYYIPYGLMMFSGVIGYSPEDKIFNFTLGTKFNLVF